MRDGDDSFDDCEGWTESSFIKRLSEIPAARSFSVVVERRPGSYPEGSKMFQLATRGCVAELQHAVAGAGRREWAQAMPELFSTVGLLEERWQNREISFTEAIRGLFAIREVIKNLESGRVLNAASTHYFGSGLIGLADGEQHVFGAQIVAEKLTVNGWRTDVNVAPGLDWMLARVRRERFQFVGVSVGSDESLSGLADQIAELRAASLNGSIDVVLGGAVFAYSNSSFDFLGADCVARTADDAISFLNTRVKTTGSSACH